MKRRNIVAFEADTGQIKRFAPRVNGDVWAIQPYKKSIFLGGEFTRVNGKRHFAIVKLNRKTGNVVRSFRSPFSSGDVTELRIFKGKLLVGGSVPGALTSPRRSHRQGHQVHAPAHRGKGRQQLRPHSGVQVRPEP